MEPPEVPPLLALHGVPTSPALWGLLPCAVEAPTLAGLSDGAPVPASLTGWLEALRPRVRPDTVLVGHDLGGVLAALLAVERPVRGLVLSGTSLSPAYWALVRASAWPGLERYFYRRHGGRKFLVGGLVPALHDDALRTFLPDVAPDDLPARMRAIARLMRVPADLVDRLRATGVPIRMIWGRHDPWYPLPLARRLARQLGADLRVVEAGHLAPWEDPDGFAAALAGWPMSPRTRPR